jgi:superfamily II DNA helicase RecQ
MTVIFAMLSKTFKVLRLSPFHAELSQVSRDETIRRFNENKLHGIVSTVAYGMVRI